MGYETKLIIGEVFSFREDDPGMWLNAIAEVNLCKSDFYATYIDKEIDISPVFIYGTDGNTQISKDRYDKQLFAIDPVKVLDFMKKHNKGKNKYRRYNAAIALLDSIIKEFDGDRLKCALYGY